MATFRLDLRSDRYLTLDLPSNHAPTDCDSIADVKIYLAFRLPCSAKVQIFSPWPYDLCFLELLPLIFSRGVKYWQEVPKYRR